MKTPLFKTISLVILLLVILSGSPAMGAIWYVDSDAPFGGDGTSWATAYRDIQSAVNSASGIWMTCMAPTDSIYVKSGTYSLTSTITINKVVNIYGGFSNNLSNPDFSNRDPETFLTIVTGNDTVRCFNLSNFCKLDGFVIEHGNAGIGSAVYMWDVEPHDCSFFWVTVKVRNCLIRDNTGTALYDDGSDVEVSDCTFSGNVSSTGGAIYHQGSSPLIERCIFTDNQATAPGSLGGGAIAGWGGNAVTGQVTRINNCLFYNNYAENKGGAIAYHQVYPRIKNCTFVNNTALNAGGAYHANITDAPRIWNCICWGNSPDQLDLLGSAGQEVRYCDIQGGYTGPSGSNNIDDNPDFVGGSDYHLQSVSPCIDTGSNGYGITDDLDGRDRPLDGDGDDVAVCDMGAYEYSFVDLIVESIETSPYKPAPGQSIEIGITITNQGTEDAGGFYLDWYADRSTPPGSGDWGDVYQSVSALAAEDTAVITLSYSGYSSAGAYQMYAQIDTDDNVVESNETNNIFGPQVINVNTCRADINEDGKVGLLDFARLSAAWLSSEGGANWDRDCDLTEPGDGNVNIDDLQITATDWLCSEPL